MAMIDYGAIVFKNGEFINRDQFFMDMEKAVGWVDVPFIRHEDCDCIWEYEDSKYSDCGHCPKAKRRESGFVIADCHGQSTSCENKANGNYYAYIGDKNLTLAFYKTMCAIYKDGKYVDTIWGCRDKDSKRHKVLRFEYGGAQIIIRSVYYTISHMSISYKGDHYNVIYGYGIDPCMRVWNRIKNQYIGSKASRDVDKLIKRYWKH